MSLRLGAACSQRLAGSGLLLRLRGISRPCRRLHARGRLECLPMRLLPRSCLLGLLGSGSRFLPCCFAQVRVPLGCAHVAKVDPARGHQACLHARARRLPCDSCLRL